MKENVKAVRYICDACGYEFIVPADRDQEPPRGYHGDGVLWVMEGGGWGCRSWYACSEICIKDAVVNAITREST